MTEPAGAPHELSLDPAGEAQWARLRRQLEYADGFWLGFVFCASPATLGVLERRTENVLRARARGQLVLAPQSPDALVDDAAHLLELVRGNTLGCVWLAALDVDDAGEADGPWARAWDRTLLTLNQAREPLRKGLGAGLLVAAPPRVKPRIREAAPDLWSIRGMVIDLPIGNASPLPRRDEPVEREVRARQPRASRRLPRSPSASMTRTRRR